MSRPSIAFPDRLAPARFLRRPNRFVVHAGLAEGPEEGEEAVCHLPDPGRLTELLVPGRRLWLRPEDGARRKTRWTVVLVESPGGDGLVSLDTTLPNRLVGRALESGALEELEGWSLRRAEATIGESRFDFLLGRGNDARLVLEVKSVTLVRDEVGLFPDAVTARGARHVRELGDVAGREGWQAAVLFVLQRPDAREIRAAPDIDSRFAEALARAREAGVRVLGRRCRVSLEGVTLGDRVPAG